MCRFIDMPHTACAISEHTDSPKGAVFYCCIQAVCSFIRIAYILPNQLAVGGHRGELNGGNLATLQNIPRAVSIEPKNIVAAQILLNTW